MTVICKDNLDNLAEITRFCKDYGIANLTFELEKRYDKGCIEQSISALKSWENLSKDNFLITENDSAFAGYSIEELKNAIEKAEKESKRINFQNQYLPASLLKNMNYYYYRELRSRFKLQCRHLLTARIDPLGNIIGCFGIRKPFGNLLKEPFEKIWNNEDFCNYRKNILGNNLLPICETCHRAESFDINFGRIN